MYEDFVDIVWGSSNNWTGLRGILGSSLKVNVQMYILGGANISKFWVCLIFQIFC